MFVLLVIGLCFDCYMVLLCYCCYFVVSDWFVVGASDLVNMDLCYVVVGVHGVYLVVAVVLVGVWC